ncbi:MAG: hypothetical protein C0592_12020 [Marinilabiliales bacterium]|nr:MAG: hypothetical protein C0592_12020 [Marinilabiliales bacterium]
MRTSFIAIIIVLLFSTSCDWINPSEEIPSYIQIDSIGFSVIGSQGSADQNFVDAWVYVNGESVGAYELPCTFPVLASGDVDIQVFPGILLNGISATRGIYPFVSDFEVSATLVEDSILHIYPTSTYNTDLEFEIIEDFESGGLVVTGSSLSDTTIERTSDPALVYEGSYSGVISLDEEHPVADIKTINDFVLPQSGAYNFIEMNFKTDVETAVGVIANIGTQSVYHPVMVLNTTDTWKKIYVNISPVVTRESQASSFYIFIRAELPDGESTATVYLDNIKIIHAQ